MNASEQAAPHQTPTPTAGHTVLPPLRILVVSPLPYHRACGNGGGVFCDEVLRRLAPHCDIHFLSFAQDATAEDAARADRAQAARSVTFVRWQPRHHSRALAWLHQLATLTPREASGHNQPAMHAALAAACRTHQPQLVLLQFPHMAQYVTSVPGVPVVIDVQDACMVSRYREWRATRGGGMLRRCKLLHSWAAWVRYEMAAYGRAQRLMALSDTDAGVLRAYVPGVPTFVSPVAWDVVLPPAGAAFSQQVVFVGNFTHAPNRDGLEWLLAEVWPRVRGRCPQACLALAGPHLPPGPRSEAAAGVQRLGFVADAGALLAGAAVSVVPYRFGGGIKIKTLESMARGCAVVATTVGSEGLGVQDGVHLCIADGAEAFADAIADLLSSPERRNRLAQAGQALVAANFSWDAKINALLQQFHQVVREAAAAAPAPAARESV